MDEQSGKLVFFQKLGYNEEDIKRVLEKLGEKALDNDILQELIIKGKGSHMEKAIVSPKISTLRLVTRGCNGTEEHGQGNNRKEESTNASNNLRPIVIDGSNVAMSHGCKKLFSCRGIELAVDWFRRRGHKYIKVFVPSWRKEQSRNETPISDQHILDELEKETIVVYTPSRKINGRRIVCYDDRYIVKLAYEKDAIIVSNDNYRDLQSENVEWKKFIQRRLLMYSFVNDRFMPPDDPLGRHGPTLYNFLMKKNASFDLEKKICPYGKKCTYGIKCKFNHPERPNPQQLSVADELLAKTKAVLIKSEKDNELLKKGHATFNPFYYYPSGCKWPEQLQSAKKLSPSFQMSLIQCFQQKRQLDYCSAVEWAGSIHQHGLGENTSLQYNPALCQDENSMMEHKFAAMHVTKRAYPPISMKNALDGMRDLHLSCCCDYNKSNDVLIPHAHSMGCTQIKQHYLPDTFMSETIPYSRFPLKIMECGCQKHHVLHTQRMSLYECNGHTDKTDIYSPCHRTNTVSFQTSDQNFCGNQNCPFSQPQLPVIITQHPSRRHLNGIDCCSAGMKGTNCPTETHLQKRKEIYTLLCGRYAADEVHRAMAAHPETTNIMQLSDQIQMDKYS